MTPGQVYREGAQKGVLMGIYLAIVFFAVVASETVPFLGMLAFFLILGIPFFVYRLMAFVHKKYLYSANFSSLWMLGISIFLGGSLICALVSFLYLQYIEPDYMYRQVEAAAGLYREIPEMQEIAKDIDLILKNGLLPTAIEVAVQMLWLTTFLGSMLSIFLALTIRLRYQHKQNGHS